MSKKIETQLNKIGIPKPKNDNFKASLKERLKYTHENRENLMQEMYVEKEKINWFWRFSKLGLSGLASFILLFFCVGGTAAYYTIPPVQDSINEVIGISSKGKLNVETEPNESKVYIDGEYYGETPLSTNLKEGKYSIRIENPGFQIYENVIEIAKHKTSKLNLKLEPLGSDSLENWLVYISTEYNYGAKYPAKWEYRETAQPEDKFRTQFINELGTITLDYSRFENENLLDIPNVNNLIIENESEGVQIGYKYLIACNSLLTITFELDEPISPNSLSYQTLESFIDNVWLECADPSYKRPTTEVDSHFVWQQGNIVYSSTFDGEDVSQFDFTGKQIKHMTNDGKWILYYNNGGIYIIDTLGNNKQRLLTPIASEGDLKPGYSLESSGWSPNGAYFIYKIDVLDFSNCGETCEGPGGLAEQTPSGIQAGYYLFDLSNGKSTYIVDSNNGSFANWSNDSEYIYLGDKDNQTTEDFHFYEYKVSDLTSYNTYTLANTDEWWSYQFDIYSREKVVIRAGNLEVTKLFLAQLADEEVKISKEIKELGWTEDQWPQFSLQGDYIISDSDNYYDIKAEKFYTYPIANNYDGIFFVDTGKVIAIENNLDNTAIDEQAGIYLFDLSSNNPIKEIWTTKDNNEFINDPMLHLN